MKRLFVSIHDVSPFYFKEIKIIFRELEKFQVSRFNILITPYWDDKYLISKNKEFVKLLKSKITENTPIVLHGYNHKSISKSLSKIGKSLGTGFDYLEFKSLSAEETEKKIKEGLNLLKKVFKVKPKGFVPPMWSYPDKNRKILEKYFQYYENLFNIDYFNHRILGLPLAYDGGENKLFTELIVRYSRLRVKMKNKGGLRLSIHPLDVKLKTFKFAIEDIKYLLKKDWKLCIYEDFIK
jgi:predicted deacetylase